MPLSSSNITQTASGADVGGAPSSFDVTLGSTSGGTVLIGFTCDEVATPPAGFMQDAHIQVDTMHHYVFRKQSSTGETTFTFTFTAGTIAAWWVDEVTGLDVSPFVAGISNGSSASVGSISTGTTGAVATSDLLCIASFTSFNSAGTAVTWSGETNSFTEAHDTTGTGFGGNRVSIAEARKFPGAGGTFESTATLSTSHPASGILVVYKAATAPVTVIDTVSIGGTFGLTALVTSRSSGNTFLDLYTEGMTVQGSIELHSDLSVTGTMNYATGVIGVTASSVTFTVGQVVQSNDTGECMVVRDAWSDDGPRWSNTTTRATVYTTSGWTVIGSASLS